MTMNGFVIHPPAVKVLATEDRGHSVEEWSDMLTERIIAVADTAPEPIRSQAHAFREHLYEAVMWHMRQAVLSDRLTLAGEARRAGMSTIADFILKR